ncbi:hypothetical protein ABIC83_006135 [Roseateles asaccharophilus]|uniref:Uncharacterized protein n=1 Tax=Roseateles asaccharophilus TaxID=582607 RepID=A0ABU2AG03_9BURK|nr:hypothetical protein [Roseateles asaccharophilus]
MTARGRRCRRPRTTHLGALSPVRATENPGKHTIWQGIGVYATRKIHY